MKKLFFPGMCFVLIQAACTVFAGTPITTLECKSTTGNTTISGIPQGEGFDLKITTGKDSIRYVDACSDIECTKQEKQGTIDVVDALYHKVFTIYFGMPIAGITDPDFRGMFYALPDTVQYEKTSRGYNAQYKAIYWGVDPQSQEPVKAFVKEPGIELTCTQKNAL